MSCTDATILCEWTSQIDPAVAALLQAQTLPAFVRQMQE